MKKGLVRLLWLIPFLLIFVLIIVFAYSKQDEAKESALSILINSDNRSETVSAWYNEDIYYVFLPSYADFNYISAIVKNGYEVEVI